MMPPYVAPRAGVSISTPGFVIPGIQGLAYSGTDDNLSAVEYDFTQAMKDSGIIWTKETPDQFLMVPLKMIPVCLR